MAAGLQDEFSLRPEPIQAAVEKILASKTFSSSGQLRSFLRFTVEKTLQGSGDQIKEYVVGVEVFGRGESFDPRTDNIVRTQAGKLRSRLERYYDTEGQDDSVLIEYPKGRYAPVFRKREVAGSLVGAPAVRRKVLWAAAVVLVLVASYLLASRRRPGPAGQAGVPSIAVLPFVDMSAEKDQGYFCDGITEELINALAQLGGLRVVARTSAFEFKDKGRDIRKIGEQLNVRAVVEGSVRKAGNKLRVTVQLNDVADGYHLWSQTYDREMKDLFAIQEDISQAIVKTLRVKVAGNDAQPAAHRYGGDPEVYDLYLKGRHHLNTTTPEGLRLALDYFHQALARDPADARALAGVAEAYYWLPMRSGMPMREALPKAKDAAQRALAIDERLAEAHSSMALALYSYDWDWQAAEREFKRALELSANHAAVHLAYSRYLTSMARTDEALREVSRAVESDPLSTSVRRQLAVVLLLRREFDASIEECRRMIALDPAFTWPTQPWAPPGWGKSNTGKRSRLCSRAGCSPPIATRFLWRGSAPVTQRWAIEPKRKKC